MLASFVYLLLKRKKRMSQRNCLTVCDHEDYRVITTSCENHGRVDFLFAQLSLKGDFEFSCFARVVNYLFAWVSYLTPHFLPVFLMIVEVVLISEMLSFTRFIS